MPKSEITAHADRKRVWFAQLKPGHGFLQEVIPINAPNDKKPQYKGAIRLDRDCKKGTRLILSGWYYHKLAFATPIIYVSIANDAARREEWGKMKRGWRKEMERQAKLKAAAKARLDARKAKKAAKEAEKAKPKVLKREDVL